MKKISLKTFGVAFGALFVLMLVLLFIGTVQGVTNLAWKKEAVEKGHAEWYMDGHTRRWRWKELLSENAQNE